MCIKWLYGHRLATERPYRVIVANVLKLLGILVV